MNFTTNASHSLSHNINKTPDKLAALQKKYEYRNKS